MRYNKINRVYWGKMGNISLNSIDKIKNKIKNIMELTRFYSLGAILASCLIIYSYAHYSENFSFFNFALLVIALCCLQMGANLFDDYIDIKEKLKTTQNLSDIKFNSLVPKARLIIEGVYSFCSVKKIIIILFLIPTLIGLYFTAISGAKIILFMIVGAILTLFYPKSAKCYLSEIIVGLIFGPLVIMGGYCAITGGFNINLFILSWAIFFSCLVLLHAHSLMDWEFDQKEGKNTLCILSKSKQNAIKILKFFIIASYSIVFLGVIFSRFNPKTLYCFLTLPIAVELLKSMEEYIEIKDVKFVPRWYFGVFENWQKIKENKIDFFMYRFYLARNFGLFFAMFVSIGTMI